MSRQLTQAEETEAQQLVQRIHQAVDSEITELAKLLLSKPTKELFGQTEFQVRDLVLRIGAKVYEEHLREKKTATKAPA